MKIVAGMNEGQLKSRIVNKQLELGADTDLVDVWMSWFKQEPCDHNKTNNERCKDCKNKGAACEGRQCV
ncbi:hypothetical protein LOH80_001417 [Salmonella enterica]|uniref:hypothetical protein n=1 Tax=Salmonella enterica TaxID=28901 RepID=UPI0009ADF74F|nr:hypothetical protein [Salmonella enterica]NBA66922.1 hypothetical protein [Salmonella enterica subsp. arizonae serovar 41:z4,z23:-]EGI2006215.1 hypothetical protein [Salmonella enterica]EHB2444108.1 hypothetical protein [Salmonella enterica]EIN2096041.1 hypothetical protein [Salmonella enterica]EIO8725966.1 hypothetical protein [Salmonella enterica]